MMQTETKVTGAAFGVLCYLQQMQRENGERPFILPKGDLTAKFGNTAAKSIATLIDAGQLRTTRVGDSWQYDVDASTRSPHDQSSLLTAAITRMNERLDALEAQVTAFSMFAVPNIEPPMNGAPARDYSAYKARAALERMLSDDEQAMLDTLVDVCTDVNNVTELQDAAQDLVAKHYTRRQVHDVFRSPRGFWYKQSFGRDGIKPTPRQVPRMIARGIEWQNANGTNGAAAEALETITALVRANTYPAGAPRKLVTAVRDAIRQPRDKQKFAFDAIRKEFTQSLEAFTIDDQQTTAA